MNSRQHYSFQSPESGRRGGLYFRLNKWASPLFYSEDIDDSGSPIHRIHAIGMSHIALYFFLILYS